MQRPRGQILASARLTRQQHRLEMRRDAADAREHLPHRGAAADHSFELRARDCFLVDGGSALPPMRFLNQLADSLPQSGDREDRLVQIIGSAFAEIASTAVSDV